MKSPRITGKAISKPMTEGESQGFECPPHCKARSIQTTADIMKKQPKGSNFRIFWVSVPELNSLSCNPFGGLKIKKIRFSTTAPIGTLLLFY